MTSRRTEILMWVSLFGAPAAWAASHIVGWGVSEARCEAVDRVWGIDFGIWEIVLLALAVLLAGTGLFASLSTYRRIRGTDKDANPPEGRLWLLSVSSLVVTPLLLVLIVLTHTGALILSHCHQG